MTTHLDPLLLRAFLINHSLMYRVQAENLARQRGCIHLPRLRNTTNPVNQDWQGTELRTYLLGYKHNKEFHVINLQRFSCCCYCCSHCVISDCRVRRLLAAPLTAQGCLDIKCSSSLISWKIRFLSEQQKHWVLNSQTAVCRLSRAELQIAAKMWLMGCH